jgi:hypothetical protein
MFCLSLQGWEGIDFGEEKPDREQMLRAIFEHVALRDFIFEKSKMATDAEKERFQDELKNSGGSENGSPSKGD